MKKGRKIEIREIDGIPVVVGDEKIGRFRRGKKPKSPMAELGFKKLKPKQKLALINKFEFGMSNRQAGISAGYSPGRASEIVTRLVSRKAIVEELEKAGMTDEKIARIIAEAGSAMHPFRPKQPDHNIRLKAAHEANVTKDNYPAKKIQIDEKVAHLHLTTRDYDNYKKYKQLTEPQDDKG